MRFLAVLALAACALAGESLTLPPLLAEHAVLQRGRPLRLAGRAAPGAPVALRLAGASATATAAADGTWTAELPALAAGGPYALEAVSGSERRTVADLLVGDVWLCAGQSNMAFSLGGAADAKRHLAELDGAPIRLLRTRRRIAAEPQAAFEAVAWTPCTAASAEGFSAVALAFAAGIRAGGEAVPVGLVQAAIPGSFCEAWIPRDELAAEPDGPRILARWAWLDANRERLVAEWEVAHAAWQRDHGERFARWAKTPGGGPFQPHEPARPQPADSPLRPGVLWNGMVAPLTGMAFRGVVWYQGESNSDRAWQYRALLARMIGAWRRAWRDPALPFILAQLPEFETDGCPYDWQDSGPWEVLRDAQAKVAATVPGVALAATLGLGERRDVHPRNKWAVGERLARAALGSAYGHPLTWRGPQPSGVDREGGRLVVRFAEPVATLDGGPPVGFVIAGADRRFVPAVAVAIAPDAIALSAPGLAAPEAARYAWDDDPAFNLAGGSGLLVAPWRSDDWPLPTAGAVVPFHRTWPE